MRTMSGSLLQIITGQLFFGQSFLLVICRIRIYWLVINISFNLQALTSTILSDNQQPMAPSAVAAVIKLDKNPELLGDPGC